LVIEEIRRRKKWYLRRQDAMRPIVLLEELARVIDHEGGCCVVVSLVCPFPCVCDLVARRCGLQKYSTTAAKAVDLMSATVWRSASSSSAFVGWGGAKQRFMLTWFCLPRGAIPGALPPGIWMNRTSKHCDCELCGRRGSSGVLLGRVGIGRGAG
jgi:hypothetical protein